MFLMVGRFFWVGFAAARHRAVARRRSLFAEQLEPRQLLAVTAGGDSFAYFFDEIDDTNVTLTMPSDGGSTVISTVIGEASYDQRQKWTRDWPKEEPTVDARVVGQSVALQGQDTAGKTLWPFIAHLFRSADPVPASGRLALAKAILNAVMVYPSPNPGQLGPEFPRPAEALPTADGGYVIWAQDFEFGPGHAPTNEVYAGITAVLWAGRQVLGEASPETTPMQIIPVVSSSIFKTLGHPTDGYYNSQTILKGTADNPYLASLGLDPLPQTNNSDPSAANPYGEWNFLSMLFHNKLIDGFLGQQYAWNNPGAVPGSVTADTVAFFPGQELPYAILSAHDQPGLPPDYPWPNLTKFPQPRNPSPPWPSHHQGNLPFAAGVYWHQDVIDPVSTFDPATVLTPTIAPLPTATPKMPPRPVLRPVTTLVLDGPIGPSPVVLSAAEVSIAAVNGRPDLSFVVSAVASGRVEKWTGTDWIDISTLPATSSPSVLLQQLQRRLVTPTDQLRWVPPADASGEQVAFALVGWSGEQASATASTVTIEAGPLPQPELVLWHEGYKASLAELFQPQAWSDYTGAIIEFATAKNIGTVMISVDFGTTTDTLPADAEGYVQQFLTAAEAASLQPGLFLTFGTQTTVAMAADYLAGFTHTQPLLIGVDVENFVGVSQPYPELKAATIMETFITPFANALTAKGVSYAEISPIGGMAVKSSWAAPMTNVYEYYSDAKDVLNPLFANHQDNATAAFAAFQDALADHTNADAIVKPDKIGGWPAFAISQLGSDCLGGESATGKANPCGIADIFGSWQWDDFEQFLGLYQKAYAPERIVIYQADQLPCGWLVNGCPPPV
jgi:hypothetical protein